MGKLCKAKQKGRLILHYHDVRGSCRSLIISRKCLYFSVNNFVLNNASYCVEKLNKDYFFVNQIKKTRKPGEPEQFSRLFLLPEKPSVFESVMNRSPPMPLLFKTKD